MLDHYSIACRFTAHVHGVNSTIQKNASESSLEKRRLSDTTQKTILCLASYFKGERFMQEAKRLGARVELLTVENLLDDPWPRDCIDEVHAMPELYNVADVIKGVSYLARTLTIDIIVALDDFDVETAARLREHLRNPGMGDTTARHFRDKLAMRVQARNCGIAVPEFIHVLNHGRLKEFTERVAPPWVLKPRSQASTIGIKKISTQDELWQALDELADQQSFNLLEQFVAGDVYHLDSIVCERRIRFTSVQKYGAPPMSVAHEGGIFTTATLPYNSSEATALKELNQQVIKSFGLVKGVTHTEFIRGQKDGVFYFLETAARVGGAHIAEFIEAATGINLWTEWARLELATPDKPYVLPKHRRVHSGMVITLSKQEQPDTSAYDDPEIWWRLSKKNHVGLIFRSKYPNRVQELLHSYVERFMRDYHASMPVPDRARH